MKKALLMKVSKSAKVETFIASIVVFAMVLGSSCTRDPNPVDGIIQIEAATGVAALSPGDMEKIKDRIPAGDGRVSRSYSKTNGKETVRVSGSASNTAVFLSGVTSETAEFRIKGTKGFVEEAIAKVHEITGENLNLNRFKLVAETRTYPFFSETEFSVLEKEIGKTMTSLGRSSSSFNELKIIKSAFENGVQEVRLKFSEEFSSLKITIEGDQQFIEQIKALVGRSKESGA